MARTAPATGEGTTVLGAGIFVRGRVSGEEDLHVEGRLEGSVELTETLFVAPGGIVVATVQARDVVVSGVVVGNVTAEDSVTLNPGAKLVGDVSAPRIIVADGAAFSGNVTMGGEAPPRRERRKAAARRPAASSNTKSTSRSQKSTKSTTKTTSKSTAKSKAQTRVAAIPTPRSVKNDDENTVVVRHAAIDDKGSGSSSKKTAKKTTKKTTKKAPPRARVPKPGKRRVGRR